VQSYIGVEMFEEILSTVYCSAVRIWLWVLMVLLALSPQVTDAADRRKPVFMHAECHGEFSSAMLSALQEKFRTSTEYQMIPTLDDNGRTDAVLLIFMSCAERNDVLAVATTLWMGSLFALQ
jgi:hypothetical protein